MSRFPKRVKTPRSLKRLRYISWAALGVLTTLALVIIFVLPANTMTHIQDSVSRKLNPSPNRRLTPREALQDSTRRDSLMLAKKKNGPVSRDEILEYYRQNPVHKNQTWPEWFKENPKIFFTAASDDDKKLIANGGTQVIVYNSPDESTAVPVQDFLKSLLSQSLLPPNVSVRTTSAFQLDPQQLGPTTWPVIIVMGPHGQEFLVGYGGFAQLPSVVEKVR